MHTFFLCFSCPRAWANTYKTVFNKCSGQLYFDGSMTPNNPCSPASSVFCKHLEETREKKKKEKIILLISTPGSGWNRRREMMKKEMLFSGTLPLLLPKPPKLGPPGFCLPPPPLLCATLYRARWVFCWWQIQNKELIPILKTSVSDFLHYTYTISRT